MEIAIASDHAGFYLKEFIKDYLKNEHKVVDYGTESGVKSVDYPDFALKLAKKVSTGIHERGILICGSGIGMSITANRVSGIRAALCEDAERAELARRHNNSNVLVLAGRYLSTTEAEKVVKIWLDTEFDGGRHERRLDKIETGE